MTEETPAAPDAGQAAPAPDAGQGAGSFLDNFEGDMRGYIENKGFQDVGALANSYKSLEALRGVPAENLVNFPLDQSDREAMLPVYAKMGMPETADKYTNILGDGFDAEVFKSVATKAHEVGLGDGQFQVLQQVMAEQSQAMVQQQETHAAEAFDAWKAGNADGFNNAAKLMADVGVSEDGLEQLLAGDKAAMYDFLSKVAARTGETQVVTGEPSQGEGFSMTPAAAKAKIAELMSDKTFTDVYYSDSKAVRAPALARMEKLQQIAARA